MALPSHAGAEADAGALKADATALNRTAAERADASQAAAVGAAAPVTLDDRALMVGGSLAFGIAIPFLTELYGPIGPGDVRFWIGGVLFIAMAFAIWAGNRWLLFKQRAHFDWFNQPVRKLMMLVTANVLYTAPVTVAGLALWFTLAGLPLDWQAVHVVVLINVICVLFVTHAYETLFLIRERESDLMRVERLQRLRAQAELGALRAQVDPHFLFNSLNSLGHLIAHDAAHAREFCDTLAEVYRYVLDSRQHDLAPLADEMHFVRRYDRLLQLRFGAAVRVRFDAALMDAATGARWRVAPLAIQTLLENAVKHNQATADAPLDVTLMLDVLGEGDGAVVVTNPIRPRTSALPSSGLGLKNLDERCRLLAARGLDVRTDGGVFTVRVPLVTRS